MNTKHKGNIAVAQAISYFSKNGFFVFIPIGDNGGSIDLVVSQDGFSTQRIQCKYTEKRHTASVQRNPNSRVWEVDLRQVKTRPRHRSEVVYDRNSFDFLFITTPDGNYLINWSEFVDKHNGIAPYTLRLGKKLQYAKI